MRTRRWMTKRRRYKDKGQPHCVVRDEDEGRRLRGPHTLSALFRTSPHCTGKT